MSGPGRLIAFEGGEAAGKSTQARLLGAVLDATVTRQPGGTGLGADLRSLLLDPSHEEIHPRAEALMMLADRAQHVEEMIRPTLDAGNHVIVDRYNASTLAYQGFGRGLDVQELERLCAWATGGLTPDLTILLDVDPRATVIRRDRAADRIEGADADFHSRVREGFLSLALIDPNGWVVVDAAASIGEVQAEIRRHVEERLAVGVRA